MRVIKVRWASAAPGEYEYFSDDTRAWHGCFAARIRAWLADGAVIYMNPRSTR